MPPSAVTWPPEQTFERMKQDQLIELDRLRELGQQGEEEKKRLAEPQGVDEYLALGIAKSIWRTLQAAVPIIFFSVSIHEMYAGYLQTVYPEFAVERDSRVAALQQKNFELLQENLELKGKPQVHSRPSVHPVLGRRAVTPTPYPVPDLSLRASGEHLPGIVRNRLRFRSRTRRQRARQHGRRRPGGACGTGLSCGMVLFALDPPGLDLRDLTEDLTEDSEDI